jgi:hypothetical protein
MPNHATLSTNPARLLVADDDQLTLRFLAENVPRHIFGLLCPGRLCARSGRPVMSGPAPSS